MKFTVSDNALIDLIADIISAHVFTNSVPAAEVADLIHTVYQALSQTAQPVADAPPKPEPAVSIRASVTPDSIICVEDGAKLNMSKRYLRTHFDMSPEEYRANWDLPRDYPMVAPSYVATRKGLVVASASAERPPPGSRWQRQRLRSGPKR